MYVLYGTTTAACSLACKCLLLLVVVIYYVFSFFNISFRQKDDVGMRTYIDILVLVLPLPLALSLWAYFNREVAPSTKTKKRNIIQNYGL
jgi:hypothetical protein